MNRTTSTFATSSVLCRQQFGLKHMGPASECDTSVVLIKINVAYLEATIRPDISVAGQTDGLTHAYR